MLLKRYISINYIDFCCILFTETVVACVGDGYFLVIFLLLRDTAARKQSRGQQQQQKQQIVLKFNSRKWRRGKVSSVRWTKRGLNNNIDTANTVDNNNKFY